MPAKFDACVSGGGKVRTKRLNNKQYMHICFMGGKSYAGEVKQYKSLTMSKSKTKPNGRKA